DRSPQKRAALVDKLLSGPHYVNHFANVWRNLLVPEFSANLQGRINGPSFTSWLRQQLTANARYDAMVRDLLTAPVGGAMQRPAVIGLNNGEPSPSGFFFAKDLMPENLAAATARVFLGVKLECAQCHNHPFAQWKREEFWSLAAFFSGIRRQGRG